jgi:uracil-DNA glycosylase
MTESLAADLDRLLQEVRACRLCEGRIPEPNPVLRASASASVLVVGQAPGTRVHASGIPWNDPSGDRLRRWMGVSADTFYDDSRVAIIPMAFCYPGKGKSGDLPPPPECAHTWHQRLHRHLPRIRCTLLIGHYAQSHYLKEKYPNLTGRVRDWRRFAPTTYVMPHPSPRNQLWLRRNPWFEEETVPRLQATLRSILE